MRVTINYKEGNFYDTILKEADKFRTSNKAAIKALKEEAKQREMKWFNQGVPLKRPSNIYDLFD